jgi:hypothetical protein
MGGGKIIREDTKNYGRNDSHFILEGREERPLFCQKIPKLRPVLLQIKDSMKVKMLEWLEPVA